MVSRTPNCIYRRWDKRATVKGMVQAVQTLYEEVATRLNSLIEDGTLRPGDKLPSVRRLHSQWSVSVSTVLEAYRLLEQGGRQTAST